MANDNLQDQPSARILPFTGHWQGRFTATEYQNEAELTALCDARQIRAAHAEANNWMATLLIGLLASMHKPDLLRLELAIGTHANPCEAASQALALIRMANGSKDHKERVAAMLDALAGPSSC